MQIYENNYKRAEREDRKENKKTIFNSKKAFGEGSFSYDVRRKIQKIRTPTLPPIYIQPILISAHPTLGLL